MQCWNVYIYTDCNSQFKRVVFETSFPSIHHSSFFVKSFHVELLEIFLRKRVVQGRHWYPRKWAYFQRYFHKDGTILINKKLSGKLLISKDTNDWIFRYDFVSWVFKALQRVWGKYTLASGQVTILPRWILELHARTARAKQCIACHCTCKAMHQKSK